MTEFATINVKSNHVISMDSIANKTVLKSAFQTNNHEKRKAVSLIAIHIYVYNIVYNAEMENNNINVHQTVILWICQMIFVIIIVKHSHVFMIHPAVISVHKKAVLLQDVLLNKQAMEYVKKYVKILLVGETWVIVIVRKMVLEYNLLLMIRLFLQQIKVILDLYFIIL